MSIANPTLFALFDGMEWAEDKLLHLLDANFTWVRKWWITRDAQDRPGHSRKGKVRLDIVFPYLRV